MHNTELFHVFGFNAFRQIRNQQNRFVSLSDLSEEASEQLATYDIYPWEYTAFPVEDEVILGSVKSYAQN